jgi:hypothetical protein
VHSKGALKGVRIITREYTACSFFHGSELRLVRPLALDVTWPWNITLRGDGWPLTAFAASLNSEEGRIMRRSKKNDSVKSDPRMTEWLNETVESLNEELKSCDETGPTEGISHEDRPNERNKQGGQDSVVEIELAAPREVNPTYGAPPEQGQIQFNGSIPGGQFELYLTCEKTISCKFLNDASNEQIRGKFGDLINQQLLQLAQCVRGLSAELLNVKTGELVLEQTLNVNKEKGLIMAGWCLSFPKSAWSQVISKEFQESLAAFAVLLIDENIWTANETELPIQSGLRAEELTLNAKKTRSLLAAKEFDQEVCLECKHWGKGITFPAKIGSAKLHSSLQSALTLNTGLKGRHR